MNLLSIMATAAVATAVLSGCAAKPKYDWGKYDSSLYVYYKAPAKAAEFSDALDAVIRGAESEHKAVPPGIYAEYGYVLMQQGRVQEASKYFSEEAAHWPESKVFMDRMIQLNSAPVKTTATTSP